MDCIRVYSYMRTYIIKCGFFILPTNYRISNLPYSFQKILADLTQKSFTLIRGDDVMICVIFTLFAQKLVRHKRNFQTFFNVFTTLL